jgi:hypothetical protein
MKSPRQRSEEKRKERLSEIRSQVDAGTLVIRQMTPEERADARSDRKSQTRRKKR